MRTVRSLGDSVGNLTKNKPWVLALTPASSLT